MNYNEWLRELIKLPKSANFCLADVTERISAGNHVINFLITEAKGHDQDARSRRGRTTEVCRPRIYIGMDKVDATEMADPNGGRCEITEPIGDVEKAFVRDYSFSLHEFFLIQNRLCHSVLISLTEKIAVISERSKALLESQLGDEIAKLVTKRLSGGDAEEAGLKTLLINQISAVMEKHIAQPVRVAVRDGDESVKELKIQDKNDLYWEYEPSSKGYAIDISLTWKGISLHWDGSNGNVSGPNLDALCVRDTFLLMVNLPSFGEMIARRLAKIME